MPLESYGITAEDPEVYRAIYEAERQYVMTRGFWKD